MYLNQWRAQSFARGIDTFRTIVTPPINQNRGGLDLKGDDIDKTRG